MSAYVFLLVAAIVFSAGIFWFLYCNDKTMRQRLDLIEVVFHEEDGSFSPDAILYQGLFRMVTYHQHFHELRMFRDPFVLYDKRLTDRLAAQGGKSDG